ncbi:hypothetical protein [Streptomyces flaveolus]
MASRHSRPAATAGIRPAGGGWFPPWGPGGDVEQEQRPLAGA